MAEELAHLVRKEARRSGITVETTMSHDCPCAINDPHQIKQAALSLVRNAMQAMPGGGRLTIATAVRPDGGTLLLDEAGTLSLPIQAKLLRTLQDGTFEPLGSTRTLQADCRIIAATNADLGRAVKGGAFREDLYYRLNVIRIALPSLKDRADDIPLLLHHFLAFHAARNHRSIDGFDPEALRALRAYDWPGNVRELSHAVERAVVLATGRVVTRACLPDGIRLASGPDPAPAPAGRVIAVPVGTPLEDVERMVISETLRHTGGNKAQAASLLGTSARTIYRKQAPDAGKIE